jgi:hypothetical protein
MQLTLNFSGKPCLHKIFVNAADPDLQLEHPGVWCWCCIDCGFEDIGAQERMGKPR